MPTDMAAPPLFLSQEDFAYRPGPKARSPATCRREARKTKKRVTFADHRGLPLARVKVFSQFKDAIRIPAGIRLQPADRGDDDDDEELILDFAQPASDGVMFRQSLDRTCVCLENCVLKERILAGTVKVKNLSFEKRVRLRVTFDSWESHSDVDCAYVEDSYLSAYGDTFSFRLALPRPLEPRRRVEFAVCYQAAGAEYWDSNRGRNYRILRAKDDRAGPFRSGVRSDAFGGLACGHGILPEWAGYADYKNVGPYY
ncbi:protein phosphatase 1 regulatory subunit 3B-like [Phyllopteryx taeniolatus]|uniref:protein phosphatase 1 regulatory subunit 3B-like n=1 Tax=Phyllopteryx taeniolatus TaxID=161469 RepID=UPI002AD30764|nr:protein phosphatase 1 regulatory subunit 3B-like [Phyllopteryx taeniolatus]XP_061603332.1 protein phosphatase 1 regulatory subunit 3B-like [Phyllopteryx taeniolatus]